MSKGRKNRGDIKTNKILLFWATLLHFRVTMSKGKVTRSNVKTSADDEINSDAERREVNPLGSSSYEEIDSGMLGNLYQEDNSSQNVEENSIVFNGATCSGLIDQSNLVTKNAESATPPLNNIMQFLSSRFDKLEENTKTQLQKMEQTCSSRFQSFLSSAQFRGIKSSIDELKENINSRIDALKEMNENTNKEMKSSLDELKESTNTRLSRIEETNKSTKAQLQKIEQTCSSRFQSLKNSIDEIVEDRENFEARIITDVDNKIKNAEQAIVTDVDNKIKNSEQGIVTDVDNKIDDRIKNSEHTIRKEFNPVLESLASRVENVEKEVLTKINEQLGNVTKCVEEIATTFAQIVEGKDKHSDSTEYLKLDRLALGRLAANKQRTADVRQTSERAEHTENQPGNQYHENIQNTETPTCSQHEHLNQAGILRRGISSAQADDNENKHHRVREHSRTRIQEHFDYKHFLTVRKFKIFRNKPNDLHPCEWLQQFEHCLPPNWPVENKLEFMCGFLENEPASRMRVHISPYTTENEFRRIFLAAYWSETTQDRVKNSIQMLKSFVRSDFASPAEYFQHMIMKNQFLTFPYNPTELIRICLNKLPSRLRQIAIAARCKDDIETFKELLEDLEEERDEHLQRERHPNQNRNTRNPYHSPERKRHSTEGSDRSSENKSRQSPEPDRRSEEHKERYESDSDREYSNNRSYHKGRSWNRDFGRKGRYNHDQYHDNRRDNYRNDKDWRNRGNYDQSGEKQNDRRRDRSGDRRTQNSRQQSPQRQSELAEIRTPDPNQNTPQNSSSRG